MNWGKKIILAYAVFMAIILTLVAMSMRHDVDLVAEDYYQQELKYQDVIDAENAAAQRPFSMNITDTGLIIQLDSVSTASGFKGSASFLRPSDDKLDFQDELTTNNNGKTIIPLTKFSAGRYEATITWVSSGVTFTRRQTIVIP